MIKSFLAFIGFTAASLGKAASIFTRSSAGTSSIEVIGSTRETASINSPKAGRTAFSNPTSERSKSAEGSAAPVACTTMAIGFTTRGREQLPQCDVGISESGRSSLLISIKNAVAPATPVPNETGFPASFRALRSCKLSTIRRELTTDKPSIGLIPCCIH